MAEPIRPRAVVSQLPPKPAVAPPAPKPLRPHSVSRELGTLLVFVVGALFGAAIAIAGTTSILDPYAKALFQHDVAQHVYSEAGK